MNIDSQDNHTSQDGMIPLAGLAIMILMAWGLVLGRLTGPTSAWLGALGTTITEGGLVAMILAAAGGYGYWLIRKLSPDSAPNGLVVVSACGLGLWMLSTAVLAIGTSFTGALTPWLWWPVIAIGVLLATWFGRQKMEAWRIPKHFDGRCLVWVVLAVSAAIWVAGATRPTATIHTPDRYDVMEYHLQVPREFFNARHIGELRHNCYSYYPLGVEMLFLLGMCLRNGAYEGMYVAQLTHGAFGLLAVAAIFGALKKDAESRGRYAAVLLGTTPIAIYLSWLAMVELAMILYTVLAVLWLRVWLQDHRPGSAACIGIALGAACAGKYLSIGLIVGPVLLAMVAASAARPAKLRAISQLPMTLALCCLLFSPWLIRNLAMTDNPVFPLATTTFGRGHWPSQAEQRWLAGHGPDPAPPVPATEDWKETDVRTKAELFYDNFVTDEQLAPMVLLLAGIGVCMVVAAGRKAAPWDISLSVILITQIAVWVTMTHGMPTRFIVPAIVPTVLLAGKVLAAISRLRANPLAVDPKASSRPWGRPVAVAVLASALAANLGITWHTYRGMTSPYPALNGFQANTQSMRHYWDMQQLPVPADSKIMLLGDARCWYWPSGSVYATAFDAESLGGIAMESVPPGEVLTELRQRGITHIAVNWHEIWRLGHDYGYPARLTTGLVEAFRKKLPPKLKIINQLELLGMRKVIEEISLPVKPGASAITDGPDWPIMTVYALPWAPVTTQPTTVPASQPKSQPTSKQASGS